MNFAGNVWSFGVGQDVDGCPPAYDRRRRLQLESKPCILQLVIPNRFPMLAVGIQLSFVQWPFNNVSAFLASCSVRAKLLSA
jgi:hypothetical protein